MKMIAPFALLFAGLLFTGCSWHKSASQSASKPSKGSGGTPTKASKQIVTPDTSLTAKVVLYNDIGRFVVMGFPVGKLPQANQPLFLYRKGLKVAEVKVNAMSTDNFVVADLVSGNAQVGEEVRDQ